MSPFAFASLSSLDRFDNGTGRLDLPIDYDDYFRLFNDPDLFAHTETVVDGNGQQRIRFDPVLIKLTLEWGYNLARKISAASYGGTFPDGYADSLTLREGSLEALGLVPPPLFQLLSQFQDGGFPLAQPLIETDFVYWMQAIRENARGTREWLVEAQRRVRFFGHAIGWDFDLVTPNPAGLSLLASRISSPPSCASLPRLNGLEIISHPTIGTDAPNAVVRHPPAPRLSTRPLPAGNPCRAVIPHPIYGPSTQNMLVPYDPMGDTSVDSGARAEEGLAIECPRAPSPWSACSSNLEYPDSPVFTHDDLEFNSPAPSYAESTRPGSPAGSYASTEDYSDDSSEAPSGDDEPIGYFTVYESDSDSDTEWGEIAIDEDVNRDYAEYQAQAEDVFYQEEGTRSNPIDLTD